MRVRPAALSERVDIKPEGGTTVYLGLLKLISNAQLCRNRCQLGLLA
ncbi:hypothetical protein R3F64_01225 [Halomonas sp. 5021]